MAVPDAGGDEILAAEQAAAEKLGFSITVVQLIRDNREEFDRFMEELERKRRRADPRNASLLGVAQPTLENFAQGLEAAFNKANKIPAASVQAVSGVVNNPALRRERTQEEIEQARHDEPEREQRYKSVESRVWEAKDNGVRMFLQEQYAGNCQICDASFDKRDGYPYFEGLYLLSQTHARWIGRPGNILCLCPTCCAKFLHGSVEADNIIEQIRALRLLREGGTGQPSLQITLCDVSVSIRFTEAHMLDLQEMVELGENMILPNKARYHPL